MGLKQLPVEAVVESASTELITAQAQAGTTVVAAFVKDGVDSQVQPEERVWNPVS